MPLSIGAQLWKKISMPKLQRLRDRTVSRSNSGSSTSSNSSKSVRFSNSCSSIHYTYGSSDYDRGFIDYGELDIGHYLRTEEDGLSTTYQYDNSTDFDDDTDSLTEQDMIWDEQVRRNTKVNMKRGHYSVAVLIQYRANI
ncbi:unnamed protein product [Absidia cylindrospora]